MDIEKRRAYQRAYRQAHKDVINERVREKRHALGEAFRESRRTYYSENKDRINARARQYYADNKKHIQKLQSETRKRNRAAGNARTMKNRRERYGNAHALVLRAIERGELAKMPCEICGEWETQAHHDDYNKPLSVRWLCDKHHKEWHAKNKPKYITKKVLTNKAGCAIMET